MTALHSNNVLRSVCAVGPHSCCLGDHFVTQQGPRFHWEPSSPRSDRPDADLGTA
jgi:hypothetical protein